MGEAVKALTKEEIFACDDLPKELVPVPEWQGAVYVRSMTGEERDKFELDCMEKRGKSHVTNLANIRARLVALCVVDETGRRLFDEMDVTRLGRKASKPLDRIFAVAKRLNGIGEEDVEDLAKN